MKSGHYFLDSTFYTLKKWKAPFKGYISQCKELCLEVSNTIEVREQLSWA